MQRRGRLRRRPEVPSSWRRTCPGPRIRGLRRRRCRRCPAPSRCVEDAVCLLVRAGDGVTRDDAVVERGVEGLFRHGVDDARGDQFGHVQGVRVGRVLDAGGGPQRALGERAGLGQDCPALGGEQLFVDLVGEAGVGDACLALEGLGFIGAEGIRGACRSRCPRGRRRRTPRSGSWRGRGRFPWPAPGRTGKR